MVCWMAVHVQESKLEKFLFIVIYFDKSAELLLFEHIYKHPYIKKTF